MNKAQRLTSDAVEASLVAEGAKQRLRTSLSFFHPDDPKNPAANIVLAELPNVKFPDLSLGWTAKELDTLAKWAHEMLDDEPENAP